MQFEQFRGAEGPHMAFSRAPFAGLGLVEYEHQVKRSGGLIGVLLGGFSPGFCLTKPQDRDASPPPPSFL